MDSKKLPYLPLHFFYYQFSPAVRVIFGILGVAVLIAAALLIFTYHSPTFWSLEVREVANPHTQAVTADTITGQYREFPLTLNAYWQEISYSAGPMSPSSGPVILFWVFQLTAWGLLIAVASEIRSRWGYLLYLLFAFFFHFSDVSRSLYGGESYEVIEFFIIVSILAFAYSLQAGLIRMKFLLRVASFVGLLFLLFGIAFLKGGWIAWHGMAATSFSYLTILSIVILFFIGKEPTNLIVFAGTNRKDPRLRFSPGVIGAAISLLLLTEFLALIQYLGFSWAPETGLAIRPLHLIVVAALFMPFTSQNQYHYVRNILTKNRSYSLLLISFALILLSFLFLIFSQGDEIFIQMIERLSIVFFFAIGLVHFVYIFGNFMPLLRKRINLYYILTNGLRIPYATIWFAGIIAVVFAEGNESWKTPRFLLYSQTVQQADQAFLQADRKAAIAAYENASFFAPGSIKSHYNLASLVVANSKRLRDAFNSYQQASAVQPFPYARLNAANLMTLNGNLDAARDILQKALEETPGNPHLANNLGMNFLASGEADSAILSFQTALISDLSLSPVYTNLAQVYDQFGRPSEAHDFFKAAAKTPNPSPAALCNILYHQLATGQPILTADDPLLSEQTDYFVRYNQEINRLKTHSIAPDPAKVKAFLRGNPSPESLILDAYLMFREDSVDNARSRIKYVAESFKSHRAQANTALGMAYFSRGVPEMARYFFQQAEAAGDPFGGLYAAKMDLDLGEADSAFEHLTQLRIQYDTLWNPVAKEMGMLYQAYGQAMIANTEWDMSTLSANEQLRIGKYADTLSDGNNALNQFLAILQEDSTQSAPFIEMGKIYNSMNDERALDNLRYGHRLHPDDTRLSLELARAHHLQGNADSAIALVNAIASDSTLALDIGELNGAIALAAGDTATAIAQWELIFQTDPFRQSTVLRLAQLYREMEAWDKGNQLITTAINRNDQHARFWYYYAVFSQAWNLPDDAGYGAVKAIELSSSPEERRAIGIEFAEEIRSIANEI